MFSGPVEHRTSHVTAPRSHTVDRALDIGHRIFALTFLLALLSFPLLFGMPPPKSLFALIEELSCLGSVLLARCAKLKARANLLSKNRRGNEFTCTMPLNLAFFAGKTASISGFSPDADNRRWLVYSVTHQAKRELRPRFVCS